jgi:hypothetical protein
MADRSGLINTLLSRVGLVPSFSQAVRLMTPSETQLPPTVSSESLEITQHTGYLNERLVDR